MMIALACLSFLGFRQPLPLSRRALDAPRRVTPAPLLCDEAMTWQEELERILSPKTAQADREVLLKDLLARGPEISQKITDAVNSGSLTSLLPEDSDLADDLSSVQRQVRLIDASAPCTCRPHISVRLPYPSRR